MKQQVFSRFTIAGCLLLAAALLATWALTSPVRGQEEQDAQPENLLSSRWRRSQEPQISTHPIHIFGTSEVVPATGTILIRNRDHVFATIHTAGLTPGAAVTAWMAVFNNPRHCATRPCTAIDLDNPHVRASLINIGGQIIGTDGAATYGAYRRVGDTTGIFQGRGTREGLLNPRRAEIHLVMRTHGPAMMNDPDMLRQQLSMFNGGCPPNTCANVQASIHAPEN
jgi:hypothetical protein